MKSILRLLILVLLLSLSPFTYGQNDSCTAKLLSDNNDYTLIGQLLLNGRDTVATDSGGSFRHPQACRLRKLSIIELQAYSYNAFTWRMEPASAANFDLKEHYESDDTLFIVMKPDLGRNSNRDAFARTGPLHTSISYSDALNIIPGIRWEYRGLDGSSVLNVRGSGLRNQFGIRNVKFYHNGMPLTYSDGYTPFEMLDPMLTGTMELQYNIQDYGAGNGGVLHISSARDTVAASPSLQINLHNTFGSYGYRAHGGTLHFKNRRMYLRAGFAYRQSKGYRNLEYLNRKNADVEIGVYLDKKRKHLLSAAVLYSYVNWGLPGSLNAAQADTSPRIANPFSLLIPAHLEKSTGKGNIRYVVYADKFRSETMLFGGGSDKYNPYGTSFFNNGIKTEKGFNSGLRQTFDIFMRRGNPLRFRANKLNNYLKIVFENQNDLVRIHETDAFVTDSVKFSGRVLQSQTFAAISLRRNIANRLYLSFSASGHLNHYRVENTLTQQRTQQTNAFGTGHIGLQFLLTRVSSLGLFIGHSYSPPLWDERILPNGTILPLRDEKKAYASITYENYMNRGSIYDNNHTIKAELYSWYFYDFIVPYYLNGSDLSLYRNAGNSVNSGLNASYDFMRYFSFRAKPSFAVFARASYGFQYYLMPRLEFENQVYTNKIMPGMPMHQGYASIGGKIFGLNISLSAQYIDRIALNFANTDYQKAYVLLNAEISYAHTIFQVLNLEFFVQGRNLTGSSYSSRLQLNAPLGRYYNPAPGAFVMAGFNIRTSNLIKSKLQSYKLNRY